MHGKGYCSAWSTGLTETLKSPQTRVFHLFCRKNPLRSHPHRQNCYVLTRLNELHQSNLAVHSKHVLLQICACIQFTYFHIWQMPQGDHNRISHVVAKYFLWLTFLSPVRLSCRLLEGLCDKEASQILQIVWHFSKFIQPCKCLVVLSLNNLNKIKGDQSAHG